MAAFYRELIIHGRGGQGTVAAAALISMAAYEDGYEALAFPKFGPERRGSPVEAYVRISSYPIRRYSQIYTPHILIIQDASLLRSAILNHLQPDTVVILNSARPPQQEGSWRDLQWVCLEASAIGYQYLGNDFPNVPLLGAFCAWLEWPATASMEKAIRTLWKNKPGDVVEKNLQAFQAGYQLTKQPEVV